ncbi:MAG: threonyl-tRNA synthetase editing domain-containing protein [Thermodesulfovibrionales bacterium]
MKLLLFYAHKWWFKTASKSLPEVPDVQMENSIENTVVVFYHAEKEDEEKGKGVLDKFIKNTKWLAGKFKTKNVVIHSFNHLSSSKASPQFSENLIKQATERLQNTGFNVMCTPFGYFNEFLIHVAGESLAKVFKEY